MKRIRLSQVAYILAFVCGGSVPFVAHCFGKWGLVAASAGIGLGAGAFLLSRPMLDLEKPGPGGGSVVPAPPTWVVITIVLSALATLLTALILLRT